MFRGEKMRPSSIWILLPAVMTIGLVLAIVCMSGPIDRVRLADTILKIGVLSERQTGSYNGIGDVVAICPASYALYDQLLAIGADSMTPKLLLAGACRQIDALNYEVDLKQNVKWHDGVQFTADDVVFTYNTLMQFDVPKFRSTVAALDRVEAVNSHTVRFVLSEPVKTLPLAIDLLPKHIWEPVVKQAGRTANPLGYLLEYEVHNPIDAGPFKFAEEVAGSHILLEANEAYHLGAPQIDGVRIVMFESVDDAVSALERAEVDFLDMQLEPSHVSKLEGRSDIKLRRNPSNDLHYIGFNLRRKPFDDINFRKTVANLIDRESIAKSTLGGMAKPVYSVMPPEISPWHNPDVPRIGVGLSKEARFNNARSVLAEAAYSREKGMLIMPSGESAAAVTILTPPVELDPFRAQIGEALARDMREIGIDTKAQQMPLVDLMEKILSHDYDMCILGWHLVPGYYYLHTFFHSSNAVAGGYNTSGYSNPDFDRLIEQAVRLDPTDAKLDGMLEDAQDMIANDLPIIPLYYREAVEAYRDDRITGWVDMVGGVVNTWSFRNFHPAE